MTVLLYLTQTVSYEDKVYGTEPELCDNEKAIYRTTVGRESEREKVFCNLGLIPRSHLNCDLELRPGNEPQLAGMLTLQFCSSISHVRC